MRWTVGVIGGSGIYEIPGLEPIGERRIGTPWGAPSDGYVEGRLGDTRVLFLPRHGRRHHIPPHAINYRANICGFKMLGAELLVSLSAVGSMREHIHPGHFVIVDQYLDLTRHRASTFFDQDVVAHVAMAEPVCPVLAKVLAQATRRVEATVHEGGVYACIEGPQFSTRAESLLYRSWDVSVIGMTALPEAKLAREAELPHVTLALATDYDCWHQAEQPVSVEAILAVMQQNARLAKRVIGLFIQESLDLEASPAVRALDHALVTPLEHISAESRARLAWLIGPLLARRGQSI